jgi:hypothetical protein
MGGMIIIAGLRDAEAQANVVPQTDATFQSTQH